ncbi:MAG: NADPH:quinone reductase [Elusimicrobia bacterium]|nr:NADPH:quinone reductase [Elusimicrobiota bacterium]
MRAIRVHEFGGPEVLRLEEVPAPKPARGQVVVAVKAVGVNPIDTYLRAGTSYKPALPFTPGRDAAGIVEAVGAGVRGFKPCERVYVSGAVGAYAERALCAQAEVHPLPENTSFEQGSALGVPYTTAHRALFGKAKTRKGETVLVHGASGGVGLAALQLGRAAGLDMLGTAGSERGLELVAAQGARQAFDHRQPDYEQRIIAATGGKGPAVILEMLANVNLGRDLALAAPGGRIVVIGCRGEVQINPRDAMSRDLTIFGMVVMNTPAAELARIHQELQAGLIGGTLRPVIGRSFPLAEAPQAHRTVLEPGACGKIVLIP